MNDLPPVRLCCGQRHWGVVCPDGKVMCCMCFERITQEDLAIIDGEKCDVCRSCHWQGMQNKPKIRQLSRTQKYKLSLEKDHKKYRGLHRKGKR